MKIKSSFFFLTCSLIVFSQNKYEVCDINDNGIYTFSEYDYSILKEIVSAINIGEAEVYISSQKQGIIKIKNVGTSPSIEKVCLPNDNIKSVFEIAINSEKKIFVTGEKKGSIYNMDESNCTYLENSTNLPNIIQSLSFDNLDNLYAGQGTEFVYRSPKSDITNFSLWYKFPEGAPSGDYVKINGKLYISWTLDNSYSNNVLFEVEVDDNNDFISYKNLGPIKSYTYGLASEYGKLYGVTPDELYEINLVDMSTRSIITNPDKQNRENHWWGAAGKHEAFKLGYNIYENLINANIQQNPISFPFTNTIPYSQKIYIRIDNLQNNTLIGIYPIDLVINKKPPLYIEEEYTLCYNGSYTPVVIKTNLDEKNYSFRWTLNGTTLPLEVSNQIKITQKGSYEVYVTDKKTQCQNYAKTKVKQSDIFINNVILQKKYIEVFALGDDTPIEYQFNGGLWQAGNIFYDFPFGVLTFKAKNSKECVSSEFIKTNQPYNLITPNGDGKNDFFTFKYPFVNGDYEITIVNRYGKTILSSKLDDSFRWDGKEKNGRILPSDTYWYVISQNGKVIYSNYIIVKNY